MPFVHVVLSDFEAERLQHTRPANPQDDLLLEPVGVVPTVKLMG